MNLIPPTQWDSYFDLFGSGRVYFARATFGKGQRVGTAPIVAMFQGLEPYYPTEPFIVTSRDSMLKINKEMEGNRNIPDWLRADCFEYFWRKRNEMLLLR